MGVNRILSRLYLQILTIGVGYQNTTALLLLSLGCDLLGPLFAHKEGVGHWKHAVDCFEKTC